MSEKYMNLDPYSKEYEEILTSLGLKNDPFPTVPPSEVNYWADNKTVLNQIKEKLLDSLLFASSNIYIFWGRIGVGKTFAANYLCGSQGINLFAKELPDSLLKKQFSIKVRPSIPRKSGELLTSIYKGIVTDLFNNILKDKELYKILKTYYKNLPDSPIKKSFYEISKETRKKHLDGSESTFIENEGFKYITDEKNKMGKLRDINDMGDVIYNLIAIHLEKYDRVSIIIDELENLSRSAIAERYQFNDLIKYMYEKIEIGLNIIFIYTFETYSEVETTLQPAVLSRIKDKIEFDLVKDESDLIEYIYDCIQKRGEINPYTFIEKEVIQKFSKKLLDNFKQISFREINREMHKFISICYRIRIEQREFDIKILKISNDLYSIYDKIIQ
jgi:hypothetical protein